MLKSGDQLRLTKKEIDDFRLLGLDLKGVQTSDDLSLTLIQWIEQVSMEEFDIIEKLARLLAREHGLKLPPKLAMVVLPTGTPAEKH